MLNFLIICFRSLLLVRALCNKLPKGWKYTSVCYLAVPVVTISIGIVTGIAYMPLAESAAETLSTSPVEALLGSLVHTTISIPFLILSVFIYRRRAASPTKAVRQVPVGAFENLNSRQSNRRP